VNSETIVLTDIANAHPNKKLTAGKDDDYDYLWCYPHSRHDFFYWLNYAYCCGLHGLLNFRPLPNAYTTHYRSNRNFFINISGGATNNNNNNNSNQPFRRQINLRLTSNYGGEFSYFVQNSSKNVFFINFSRLCKAFS